MYLTRVLLFSVLSLQQIANSTQKLKVLSPEVLSNELPEKLGFVPAHYGDMPYGSTLVGYLHASNSLDGCSSINHIESYDDYDNQPIQIVNRGNCSFLTKSLHAQHAGAKMLIVVNDSDEIDYDPVTGNAHKESKLKIPTIFVSKAVGEKLLNFVSGDLTDQKKSVILEFTLPIPVTDVVNLDVVLTAVDNSAIEFVANFREQVEHLGDKLNMELLWYHDSIDKSNFTADELKAVCLDSNPEACLTDVKSPIEVLRTQEFLSCAYHVQENTKFLEFLDIYNTRCLSKGITIMVDKVQKTTSTSICTCPDGTYAPIVNNNVNDCKLNKNVDHKCHGGKITGCKESNNFGATQVFCPYRNDDKNERRVVGTEECAILAHGEFIQKKLDRENQYGKVNLDQSHKDSKTNKECYQKPAKKHELFLKTQSKINKAGVYVHPTALINGKAIYGSLNTENVFNAICEAFIDPPTICTFVKNKYHMSEEIGDQIKSHANHLYGFWIANCLTLLVIFCCAGAIFYFVFKKMYKNVISHQIDGMVRDTMANYSRIDDV